MLDGLPMILKTVVQVSLHSILLIQLLNSVIITVVCMPASHLNTVLCANNHAFILLDP